MGTEYLRDVEVTAYLEGVSERTLLNSVEQFTSTIPGIVGGNASTRTLTLDTSEGDSLSGRGSVLLTGQDATGTGNTKAINHTMNFHPRNAAHVADRRLRVRAAWKTRTALADWVTTALVIQHYDKVNQNRAEICYHSNLGATNEWQYLAANGTRTALTLSPTSTKVMPDVWQYLEINVDFTNKTYGTCLINGRDCGLSGLDTKETASASDDEYYQCILDFHIDADNGSHTMNWDYILIEEVA
jgi:hypothetical protein